VSFNLRSSRIRSLSKISFLLPGRYLFIRDATQKSPDPEPVPNCRNSNKIFRTILQLFAMKFHLFSRTPRLNTRITFSCLLTRIAVSNTCRIRSKFRVNIHYPYTFTATYGHAYLKRDDGRRYWSVGRRRRQGSLRPQIFAIPDGSVQLR